MEQQKLLYDPANLIWNPLHTINEQHQYCYCGKDRSLMELALQCKDCRNWFHASCLDISLGPVMTFITNYKFQCKNCNENGKEIFKRTTAGWKEIVGSSIANLILQNHMQEYVATSGDKRYFSANVQNIKPFTYYFNKKDHIIPFVDKNWSILCTERSRTPTWWATLGSCLYTNKDTFAARDEKNRSAASDFCLINPNLWDIRSESFTDPNDVTTTQKFTFTKSKTTGYRTAKRSQNPLLTPVKISTPDNNNNNNVGIGNNNNHHNNSAAAFVQSGEQRNLRNGFRYIPCQKDDLFPIIGYRNSEQFPYGVRLSKEDASLSVYISADQLTATTEKGFRMARANCSVREGKWFYEVYVVRGGEGQIRGKDGAHVRIGWARREGNRNAPVGFDGYSYGIRDLTGQKVHQSRPKSFGEPFKTGDTIGLFISLPPLEKVYPDYKVKSAKRHRTAITLKGSPAFEYKDYKPTKQMDDLLNPPIKKKFESSSSSSNLCQGVAFEDLYSFLPCPDEFTRKDELTDDDGTLGYYPAISMYGGGTCTVNFGPYFRYPPPADPEAEIKLPPTPSSTPPSPVVATSAAPTVTVAKETRTWRPMSARYKEFIAEDIVYDVIDEIESWARWLGYERVDTKKSLTAATTTDRKKKRKIVKESNLDED
ncbi:993_t:CDS:2 [Ambispora gerdemannii]|uniref:993_t:CDS:1 n=1 Tax=Ambispora gerdemannii TaxID=144530 RepID=A0A9N9C4T3_9GLOM|nr:993_t:CDS:2 [Ambispora gerdemannii]